MRPTGKEVDQKAIRQRKNKGCRFDCIVNRALDLDGLSMAFHDECWDVIKSNFMKCFEFFENGKCEDVKSICCLGSEEKKS